MNTESEGGKLDFGNHNQPQSEPPRPEIRPSAQNEDPEVDKHRHCGRCPAKQYPDPFLKRE